MVHGNSSVRFSYHSTSRCFGLANEQGNVASTNGQSDRALEWYRRAILTDPGTTAYHTRRPDERHGFYASGDPQSLIQAVEELTICQIRILWMAGFLSVWVCSIGCSPTGPISEDQRSNLIARAMASYEEAINADPFSPFKLSRTGKNLDGGKDKFRTHRHCS